MKTNVTPWTARLAALVSLVGVSGFAQAPATTSVPGQVESVDAASRTLKIHLEDGATLIVGLAEKGTVVKVAPGEKSLLNATPIPFEGMATGDRVLVRGGVRNDGRIEGALRVIVMAKTDLTARDEGELRAWHERGVAGTLATADPANHEFIITTSAPTATPVAANAQGANALVPNALMVDARKAILHRYADTSVKFDDARPASVSDMTAGDQVRILGTKSADGSKMTAERVVFGSFKTMALAIEKVDPTTGMLSVKDLESNKKFTLSVVAGGSIRRIPAEMGAMLAMMSGVGGGRLGGMRPDGAGAAGGANPGAGRPEGGRGQGTGGHGMGGPGGARGNRSMEDMVDRMPAITIADLKKDDWVGAVVSRIDTSGKAVAFNMLAGIEVFAARANRSGGVDVGMPAGLLDGALGVP